VTRFNAFILPQASRLTAFSTARHRPSEADALSSFNDRTPIRRQPYQSKVGHWNRPDSHLFR
jgi:hypothetical protein